MLTYDSVKVLLDEWMHEKFQRKCSTWVQNVWYLCAYSVELQHSKVYSNIQFKCLADVEQRFNNARIIINIGECWLPAPHIPVVTCVAMVHAVWLHAYGVCGATSDTPPPGLFFFFWKAIFDLHCRNIHYHDTCRCTIFYRMHNSKTLIHTYRHSFLWVLHCPERGW